MKSILLSFLAGAATGAVIGVLFAPDKGSNTRRKFLLKSNDFTDELEEKFNDLIDTITEQFHAVDEDANLVDDTEIHETEKVKE